MTKSTSILISHVLPHLVNPGTTNTTKTLQQRLEPRTVSNHIDNLTLSVRLSSALCCSVSLSASYIVQGLRGALANWNLRSIAQLLFIDGPMTSTALTQTASTLTGTVCPQYSFPALSSMHAIEHCSRLCFSGAHDSSVIFKVS